MVYADGVTGQPSAGGLGKVVMGKKNLTRPIDTKTKSISYNTGTPDLLLDLNDTSGDTSTDIQFGWSVNIDQSPFVGKPVLFYTVRKTSGTAIQLKDSSNNTLGAIST